jgi:hypothetical protein
MNKLSNVERPVNVERSDNLERPPKSRSVNFIRELAFIRESDASRLKKEVDSFKYAESRDIFKQTSHLSIQKDLIQDGFFIREKASWRQNEWDDKFVQPAKLTGLDLTDQTHREKIKDGYKKLTTYGITVKERRVQLVTMVSETKSKLSQEFAAHIESKTITNCQRFLDKKMKELDQGLAKLISKIDRARVMHTDLYDQGGHNLLEEIRQEPAPVYAPHPIEGEQLPAYTPPIEGEQHTPLIEGEQHTPPILDEQLPAYTEIGFLA